MPPGPIVEGRRAGVLSGWAEMQAWLAGRADLASSPRPRQRFPSTGSSGAYTDTFTDTAGTLLTAHTPDAGGTWTKVTGNNVVITAANRARHSGSFATTSLHYHSPVAATEDYDVSASITQLSALANSGAGLIGRYDAASDSGYMVRYSPGVIQLFRRVSGAFSAALAAPSFTATTGVPFRLTLRFVVSTVKVLKDGVEVISYNDLTAVSGPGRAGVSFFASGTAPADSTGFHLDNFQGIPAGTGAYTLACSPGSFALSGKAAGLSRAGLLAAAGGPFLLAGQAAAPLASRPIPCAAGSFLLAGTEATLGTGSYTDTFTDLAGTNLATHTPDAGGSWAQVGAISARITTGNRLRLNAGSTASVIFWHSARPLSADHQTSAELVLLSSRNGQGAGVVGRYDAATDSGYMLRYFHPNTDIQLYRRTSGAFALLATSNYAAAAGVPFRLTLDMAGATIRGLLDDVEVISYTDATPILAAGRAGVALASQAAPGDTVGLHLDNFNGPEPAASYTLACSPGVFLIDGRAATLRLVRLAAASPGEFLIIGRDAGLVGTHLLASDVGTYTTTGIPAAFIKPPRISFAGVVGEFLIDGLSADPRAARPLAAGTGVFILDGVGSFFGRTVVDTLIAWPGAFEVDGRDATLDYEAVPAALPVAAYPELGATWDVTLPYLSKPDAGAASWEPSSPDVSVVFSPEGPPPAITGLVATAGVFLLEGKDAGSSRLGNRRLVADPGSLVATGKAALLGRTASRSLEAGAGSLATAGSPAALDYTGAPPGAFAMSADAGPFSLAGKSALLQYSGGDLGGLDLLGVI